VILFDDLDGGGSVYTRLSVQLMVVGSRVAVLCCQVICLSFCGWLSGDDGLSG